MEESALTDVYSDQLLPESKIMDLKQYMNLTKVMISHAKTPSV